MPDTVSYSSYNSITASRVQNIEDLIAVPRPQTHERLESDRVRVAQIAKLTGSAEVISLIGCLGPH